MKLLLQSLTGLQRCTQRALNCMESVQTPMTRIFPSPAVVAYNPLIGIWGFVLGSAFIAWSQVRRRLCAVDSKRLQQTPV